MRVLVTGGTGYVGSHMVLALLRAGHEVRLLVRRPEQVAQTFGPHSVSFAADDVVTGDVLDADSVKRALEGCDAVVHAAAIFSLDPRHAKAMLETNAQATRVVLTAALERGCDPAVHISSSVALMRHGGSGPDLPLGRHRARLQQVEDPPEIEARKLQDEGRPVVTVYPGAIFGPHDPYVGSQTERFLWVVRGWFPVWSRGGVLASDVRDSAAVVAAVMEPGKGPRRYVVPGIQMTGNDLYSAVAKAIGRRRPHVDIPAVMGLWSSKAVDAVQARLPARFHYPADSEAAEMAVRDTHLDDTPARHDLGITPTPFEQSVRDEIEWAVDAGHLPAKYRPLGSNLSSSPQLSMSSRRPWPPCRSSQARHSRSITAYAARTAYGSPSSTVSTCGSKRSADHSGTDRALGAPRRVRARPDPKIEPPVHRLGRVEAAFEDPAVAVGLERAVGHVDVPVELVAIEQHPTGLVDRVRRLASYGCGSPGS